MNCDKCIEEKKFENYGNLRIILMEITDEILEHHNSFPAVRAIMGQKISEYKQLEGMFLTAILAFPDIVKANENGSFALRMIEPENTNAEDPIFNTFTLVRIDDIFWVRRIVDNAFFNLIDKDAVREGID